MNNLSARNFLPAKAAVAVLLAASLPSSAPAEPAAAPSGDPPVRVAKWKGDARGAISLYYDDGTETSFRNVLPELVRRGLPGTFYLCGGWFGSEDNPNLVRWGEAAKAHPDVVFLGDHTWAHGGVTNAAQFAEEIARNGALLRRLAGLPEDEPLSFALPGAVRWDVTREEQAKVLADHREVLRHPFEPNIAGPKGGDNPTFSMRTAADAARAFDRAEREGGWESLIFHGVGGDWIAFDLAEHGAMLDDLEARAKAGRLWVGSAIDVHRYAAARDAAGLKVLRSDADGIDFLLAGLDPAAEGALSPRFAAPLTIVCDVPAGWTTARVECPRGAAKGESFAVAAKDGRLVFDLPLGWTGVSVRPAPAR